MADPSRYSDADDARAVETDPDPGTAGAPRWVKVFGIIAVVLVLLLVVLLLFGGGNHGPGRHLGAAGDGDGDGDSLTSGLVYDVEAL